MGLQSPYCCPCKHSTCCDLCGMSARVRCFLPPRFCTTRTCEDEGCQLAAAAVPAGCKLQRVDHAVQRAGRIVGLGSHPLHSGARGARVGSSHDGRTAAQFAELSAECRRSTGGLTSASAGKSCTSAAMVTGGRDGVSYCRVATEAVALACTAAGASKMAQRL